jgi:hypothetical protein
MVTRIAPISDSLKLKSIGTSVPRLNPSPSLEVEAESVLRHAKKAERQGSMSEAVPIPINFHIVEIGAALVTVYKTNERQGRTLASEAMISYYFK